VICGDQDIDDQVHAGFDCDEVADYGSGDLFETHFQPPKAPFREVRLRSKKLSCITQAKTIRLSWVWDNIIPDVLQKASRIYRPVGDCTIRSDGNRKGSRLKKFFTVFLGSI
jgi:hypothetical protein